MVFLIFLFFLLKNNGFLVFLVFLVFWGRGGRAGLRKGFDPARLRILPPILGIPGPTSFNPRGPKPNAPNKN